jgi:hypothetical protein
MYTLAHIDFLFSETINNVTWENEKYCAKKIEYIYLGTLKKQWPLWKNYEYVLSVLFYCCLCINRRKKKRGKKNILCWYCLYLLNCIVSFLFFFFAHQIANKLIMKKKMKRKYKFLMLDIFYGIRSSVIYIPFYVALHTLPILNDREIKKMWQWRGMT